MAASPNTTASADAIRISDLTTLLSPRPISHGSRPSDPLSSSDPQANTPSTTQTTILPSSDLLLNTLQARARQELPCTLVGAKTLILVNPLKNLGSSNDAIANACARKTLYPRWMVGGDNSGGGGANGNGKGKKISRDDLKAAGTVDRWMSQPGLYDFAGRVWREMVVRGQDEAVVFHGLTNSGKTFSSKLFTHQLLRLSASSTPTSDPVAWVNKPSRLSNQVQSLLTVLESFGSAKTIHNASASQHGRYLELFFTAAVSEHSQKGWADFGPMAGGGRLTGGKLLTFGLNKSRLIKMDREERSFHVFYQLLAGASPEERDALGLEEPSFYHCLAKSGCYRLPGGPFSDDATQFDELRVAFANLGFKHKHLQSIFSLLVTILLLGNVGFADHSGHGGLTYESAYVDHHSRHVLDQVAHRLGVKSEDLEQALTNETKWLRRELCSSFLDARGAEKQRDNLMKDLYAILFAFVVETANRKIAPPDQEDDESPRDTKIVQFELPGFQSRTQNEGAGTASGHQPLITTTGQNGVDEFTINFSNELLQSYLSRRTFVDGTSPSSARMTQDGIELPGITVVDNSACVELLRGAVLDSPNAHRFAVHPSGIAGLLEHACSTALPTQQAEETNAQDQALLDNLSTTFARYPSFVANPFGTSGPATGSRPLLFGINHYAGVCAYDARHFIESNTDVIDSQLIALLRYSSEPFVSKLVSGPSIAAESHPLDPNTIVQAQVAITPLRKPTFLPEPAESLDDSLAHPITTQTNATLAELLESMDDLSLWSVICIRPNDSGHPNSFDKRRVKSQMRSFLLTDLLPRKQVEWVADSTFTDFAEAFGIGSAGMETEQAAPAVEEFLLSRDLKPSHDFVLGSTRVWLGYQAWKNLCDTFYVPADDDILGDGAATPFSGSSDHGGSSSVPFGGQHAYHDSHNNGESTDDLLARGPRNVHGDIRDRNYGDQDNASSLWAAGGPNPDAFADSPVYDDEKHLFPEGLETAPVLNSSKEANGIRVLEKQTEVEVVPMTSARKWWVRITWLFTWFIPSFLLSSLGRMKRPDIRMAWREKLTIFTMIILACGTVLFYIIVFGMLLCPNSNKAWNTSQLAEHAGTNDYYAAIAGKVYDFTSFYKMQHSDLSSYTTTSDIMLEFAGLDLTNYFPMPMTIACPGLVTSTDLTMMHGNFTPILDYAIHTSGPLQTTDGTKLNDINWYPDRLSPFIKQYYKGDFVWDKSDIQQQADDGTKMWAIYNSKVFDLSDYFYTVTYYSGSSGEGVPDAEFMDAKVTDLFKQSPGTDITKELNAALASMDSTKADQTMTCLDNAYYLGVTDFRKTPRCLVQNYMLLAFSILLMTVTAAKCESVPFPASCLTSLTFPCNLQSSRHCSSAVRDTPSCWINSLSAKYLVTRKERSPCVEPLIRWLA